MTRGEEVMDVMLHGGFVKAFQTGGKCGEVKEGTRAFTSYSWLRSNPNAPGPEWRACGSTY